MAKTKIAIACEGGGSQAAFTAESPSWGRVMAFWQDNTAQGWLEQTFNSFVVNSIRMVNRGPIPVSDQRPAGSSGGL